MKIMLLYTLSYFNLDLIFRFLEKFNLVIDILFCTFKLFLVQIETQLHVFVDVRV